MDMPKKDKYKKVAYYPGCALEGTGHAYNRSTKAVGKALGLDLVEVAPDYDRDGTTAFLAAQLLMNVMGYMMHAKGKSR